MVELRYLSKIGSKLALKKPTLLPSLRGLESLLSTRESSFAVHVLVWCAENFVKGRGFGIFEVSRSADC